MFVNHIIAKTPDLPPMGPYLYEYVIGSNGVFVRAKRPGLEAQIRVASTVHEIRGLTEVQPYVRIEKRISAALVYQVFATAYRMNGNEILYYLQPDPWRIFIPDQVQNGVSVHPVDPFIGGPDTMVEIHSHHAMKAFFSRADDLEEKAGFRIYAVVGQVNQNRPIIAVRVGIYGYFWKIPACWVFDLPDFVEDEFVDSLDFIYEDIEDGN
jgi:PRTRC genetic system protein A